MWLPKFIYETIPFYWIALGAAGIGAAFYIEQWAWAEVSAGAGAVALIVGLMLLLRRKGYRSSRSRIDFDRTD